MSNSKQKQLQVDSKNLTDYLNLKVRSQEGEEVYFKIKPSTPLKKLMDSYISRQRLYAANVRFIFDGEHVSHEQKPTDLNM